jgi:hypothetical protein
MGITYTEEQLHAIYALENGHADHDQQQEIYNLIEEIEKNARLNGFTLPDFKPTDKPKVNNSLERNQKIWNRVHRDGALKTHAINEAAEELHKDESSIRKPYNSFELELKEIISNTTFIMPDGTEVNASDIPIYFKED